VISPAVSTTPFRPRWPPRPFRRWSCHAEVCKRELAILWADYGWPNAPADFDLHGTFNAALKLAGQCKQNVDMAKCEELVATCDTIATAFWATKGETYSDPHSAARYGS